MNNVTIVGRITKDLELRTTNNEKSTKLIYTLPSLT